MNKELHILSESITTQLIEMGFDWEHNWEYPDTKYTPVQYTGPHKECKNTKTATVGEAKPRIEIDLACKWLRDNHNLYVKPIVSPEGIQSGIYNSVENYTINLNAISNYYFDTYEEAQEYAVQVALVLIKDNCRAITDVANKSKILGGVSC